MPSPVRFGVVKKLLEPIEAWPSRRAMERGKAIAARYQVKLWQEDGHWFGVGVEEPGTYGDGRTLQECVRDVREALAITVAWHIDDGEPVARPIVENDRKARRKVG